LKKSTKHKKNIAQKPSQIKSSLEVKKNDMSLISSSDKDGNKTDLQSIIVNQGLKKKVMTSECKLVLLTQ